MSTTYTITPTMSGWKASGSNNVKGSTTNLGSTASLLKAYTSTNSSNKIGQTSSFATGYAVRADWPSNDTVTYLQNLPTGVRITNITINIRCSSVSSGSGVRLFYGPLKSGTASGYGARLKDPVTVDSETTYYNGYRGFTQGTTNIILSLVDGDTDVLYKLLSDTGSLCDYGIGFGGTTSSAYNYTVNSCTVTVETEQSASTNNITYVGNGNMITGKLYYNNGTALVPSYLYYNNGSNLISTQ